jgi:hypothetical protein
MPLDWATFTEDEWASFTDDDEWETFLLHWTVYLVFTAPQTWVPGSTRPVTFVPGSTAKKTYPVGTEL